MSAPLITEHVIAAYCMCPRKAYKLLFERDSGKDQRYATFLNQRRNEIEQAFFSTKDSWLPFSSDKLMGKAEIITNATLHKRNLTVKHVHLQKRESESRFGNYSYEPLIFVLQNAINPPVRVYASYVGDVLSQVQGTKARKATIVLIDGSKTSVNLIKDSHIHVIREIEDWLISKPEIPQVIFNKHCPTCRFEESCRLEAEKNDSICLLGNIGSKALKKYESKGIFTIRQLSYLYKPRRRSRHWGDRKLRHEYELQALALRTKRIYTNETLAPPNADIEIFIDIESAAEQHFHYLIGVLICTSESHAYSPLWADNISDEKYIWDQFIQITKQYPNAPIFHYGDYERKVIKELGARHNTVVDDLYSRLFNVNAYIFGRIYFPTRSNRLKDICEYLGFRWTSAISSGLDSIVCRYRYDKTHESAIREELVKYNYEDCANLKGLKDIIVGICRGLGNPAVTAANEQNQLLSDASSEVVRQLDAVLASAHGDYEQSKLSLTKTKSKGYLRRKGRTGNSKYIIPKAQIDKVVRVPRGRICPIHKRPLISTNETAEHVIVDLVCTRKGIKKVTTKFVGQKGRCPNCSRRHHPPRLRRLAKHSKYGDGLKAWVAYQRLAMRLPFSKISQLAEDTFNIWIASGGIHTLFRAFSASYLKTEALLLRRLMASPKVHVDETRVNIQGTLQYVWVFTDGEYVVFRLTPTREANIVHQTLNGYSGILVSDFFAGYDAVKCRQQKCWVHLIRDINEDLRKSPFDSEFESFVLALRDLLLPIFDTVERYGLRRRHLRKFKSTAERFFRRHIINAHYKSEITKKYQKRFSRYRESLFVFLEYDDIPWNNNMAERALRHLAVQRKISGSFFTSGMTEYLVLLGITQTCRFQNKPLLAFLMSGETDIDQFKGKKDVQGWLMK